MERPANVSSQLKEKGCRSSATRSFVLKLLSEKSEPFSAPDLQKLLKENKINVNKTTLYRELNFLKENGVILEIRLRGNRRWYELASRKHHHHVICVKCGKVKDFTEHSLKNIISRVLKKSPDFAEITNHTFDFFGLCKSCVKR